MTPIPRFLLFLLLALPFAVHAQQHMLHASVYFETGKAALSPQARTTLARLCDSLKNSSGYVVSVEGNTDNVGDAAANRRLSAERVDSVQRFLQARGIAKNMFSVASFGEDKPKAANTDAQGKQENRRVDITVRFAPAVRKDNIRALYRSTVVPPQEFCINPLRDTVLRCAKGTVISIRARSLKASPGCACVTLKVKEDFLKSDMILDDLSTVSNGALLESQGMLYTEATDCSGKKLSLARGKDLLVMVPSDKTVPEAKIFNGSRTGHDSVMNWTVANSAALKNFTVERLDDCVDFFELSCRMECYRVPFFFGRIARAGKPFAGLVNGTVRSDNQQFRSCQRELRREARRARRSGNTPPVSATIAVPPDTTSMEWFNCKDLAKLFEKYGVSNRKDLVYAINKPLLDSFRVTTLAALQDTLTKLHEHKIEMDYLGNSISYRDLNYYVYNMPKLGWSNVDVFADLKKNELATVTVNLAPGVDTDCKLVLKDRRSIIPATVQNGKYVVSGIPRGAEAWIVAMRIEEGKPELCILPVTIDNRAYDVTLQTLSLGELKAALKQLDQ